jgi:hypothetical protein
MLNGSLSGLKAAGFHLSLTGRSCLSDDSLAFLIYAEHRDALIAVGLPMETASRPQPTIS